ncbi:MAG: hypothetical protein M3Q58_01045 [Bacteroidota bacterium]|nr:hypothetical protein [Bacteroidota bacterium]
MGNNKKTTTKPMKGEDKKERLQSNPAKRKREVMSIKGEDPDKKLEKGRTPESDKRAT